MGLTVDTLTLCNWRNFQEQHLSFSPEVTIIYGANAIGKTNIVEALQILTAGYSFRHPKPHQLVREGQLKGSASAHISGDGRQIDVGCTVQEGKRSFLCNGKPRRSSDMPHLLMSILFNPDDLAFVKASARIRRSEIDDFGRQASSGYSRLLTTYLRVVEQRNRLLKEDALPLELLDAWDLSLAAGAAALLDARIKLYIRLQEKFLSIYEELSGGEKISCSYRASVGDIHDLTRAELEELCLSALQKARSDDIRRQQTTLGPHRDDMVFTLKGRDVRDYGSQGQQRTVVLAWKMAEVEVARDIIGSQPLLLLDDVMSELDASRREAVIRFVRKGIQTVVTTTNLGYFSDDIRQAAKVVTFSSHE